MPAADTAKMIAELGLVDKLSPGLKKAQGNLGKFESGMGRVGKGIGQVSAGLTRAGLFVGGAVATGLAGAAKAAIDWEDAFTGVVKTVDEADLKASGLTFDDLEKSLRRLATEMPTTAAELAAIAEAGGAMGVAGKDIEAFTKQVAILAATTNVSAEDAATALGQMQNVIGLTGDEFDNFAASLVALGNAGASTEAQILEIARRAGGAANLFGIAKEETLGWASAAANLGLNEELAGTALQNIFVKLLPKVQKGSKDLQKIMDKSAKAIREDFAEDSSAALEELISDIGKLPKDKRLQAVQSLFGKGSGITRLVLGLADSYEKNLAPSLDKATQSWEEATAAQIEFDKRNQTVRSAITRLRNGIYEAAITLGEGFTPALGRAATKLSEFLRDDQNASALKAIGEDIGEAIDKINWKEVLDGARDFVDVMKVALDFAQKIFNVINALPTEVKGAGLGVLALDKLSGGAVSSGAGNIVGGLGEALAKSLAAKIPLFGKAFVQPVFVTNPGFGLPGSNVPGADPPGSNKGILDTLKTLATAVGSIGLAAGSGLVIAGIAPVAASELAKAIVTGATGKTVEQVDLEGRMETAVARGLRADAVPAIRGIPGEFSRDIATWGQTQADRTADAKEAIQTLRKEEQTGRRETKSELDALKAQVQRQGERGVSATDQSKQAQTAKQAETTRETTRGATAVAAAERAGAASTIGAIFTMTSILAATIRANRPVINLTTVNRTYNRTTNYGNRSGDRDHAVGGNFGPVIE